MNQKLSQELHEQINELTQKLCNLPTWKIFDLSIWEQITNISSLYLKTLLPATFDVPYRTDNRFSSASYNYFKIYNEILTDIYTYHALQASKYVAISDCINHYISTFEDGKDEKNIKLNLVKFSEKYNDFFGDYLFSSLGITDIIKYNSQSSTKIEAIREIFSIPILAFMNKIGSKKWVKPEDSLIKLQEAIIHINKVTNHEKYTNLTNYYIERFWGLDYLSQVYSTLVHEQITPNRSYTPDFTRIHIEKYLWGLYYPYTSQRNIALTEAMEHMNALKKPTKFEGNPALKLAGWNLQEICSNIAQTKLIVTIANIFFSKLCETHGKETILRLLGEYIHTQNKGNNYYQLLQQSFKNIERQTSKLTNRNFPSPIIVEEYLALRHNINTFGGLHLYSPGFIRPILSRDFTDNEVNDMVANISKFYSKRSNQDYLNTFYF